MDVVDKPQLYIKITKVATSNIKAVTNLSFKVVLYKAFLNKSRWEG